jgi:hypothetical protein
MRNRFVRIGVTGAVAALLLLGAACEQETTAEKQQAFCEEVSQLNAAVKSLDDLGPTATVDQLKDAEQAVREQAEEVRRAFRSLEESKEENLDQAVENVKQTVRSISGDDTIAQAKATVAQDLAAVRVAAEQLANTYNCPR